MFEVLWYAKAAFTNIPPFAPLGPTMSHCHSTPLTPYQTTFAASIHAVLGIKSANTPPFRPMTLSYAACPSSQNTDSRPWPEWMWPKT